MSLTREQRIGHTFLLSFSEHFSDWSFELGSLSPGEWQHLLRWLDLSGLALSFFDRIIGFEVHHLLPAPVLARLEQNLQDNTERTSGMIAESIEMQRDFRMLVFAIRF
jgi:hypothetical protein